MSHEAEHLQRKYYGRTASSYDAMHTSRRSSHDDALAHLTMLLSAIGAESVLDVGTGTGRALSALRKQFPALQLCGVEPSEELRALAQEKAPGVTFVDGSGEHLPYADDAFDIVCEFGMLHHVPNPHQVVSEMLRVARLGVFISDSNRFGQGSTRNRLLKLAMAATGTWRAFDFVRTRGKGYMVSEGDGLFYSYSLYDNLSALRASGWKVDVMGLDPSPSKSWMHWFGPLATCKSVVAIALSPSGTEALYRQSTSSA